MNTIFILAGCTCLLLSDAYKPWKLQWRLMHLTFGETYQAHLRKELPRRPAWSGPSAFRLRSQAAKRRDRIG